jgi:hypothetical protein
VKITMGLLRTWLWYRSRYPSWVFWLGLLISIPLAPVVLVLMLVTTCLDIMRLALLGIWRLSRWTGTRLVGGSRRSPGATVSSVPRRAPRRNGPVTLPADRRVRVVVLGFPGCGKTLMLAGLYYYFAQGGPTGIRLSADHDSNGRLLSLVAQIRSPDGYFPPGTSVTETRTWSFQVKVESECDDTDAFTLEYLDYAGRLVEELTGAGTDDPPDEQFLAAVGNADVLMGVIDGEQLAGLMSGRYDSRAVDHVDRLLNFLTRASQRNVHLVISKWDLLVRADGGRYTMADIRGKLANVSPAFSNFQRNPRLGKLRIIPVASLGMNGFVAPAPAGGGMVRNQGVEWSPWNVEVPFFCAVPDIIRYDVDRLAAASAPAKASLTRRVARITLAVFAISGVTAKVAVPGITLNIPVSEAVGRIRRRLDERYARGQAPADLDEGAAIGYVVNECYGSVDEFERRWPDSRLGARGAW